MSDAPVAASRVSTLDGAPDLYDHEISLVDTTEPELSRSRTESPGPGSRKLGKKPTRGSIREQLARRKYARYSYERYSKGESLAADDEDEADNPAGPNEEPGFQPDDTQAVDFAERGRQGNAVKKKKHRGPASEVDILYENQRGSFFFGIPLYSHSSLLNFDPAPWVNKDLKDSPVNITNAQVPDPTWQWLWKTWYVDMSYDVDEQGWQYSFSFGKNFAWHGTHPWFHSFVRRRRWLRKRVRHETAALTGPKSSSMSVAHKLNTDYFTIHPKREQSPASHHPESYLSVKTADTERPPEDIKDVGSLMKALRFATVDREKIDIFKKFVEDGGEELAYLSSTLPEVMSFLVFQNSKQQLLTYLKRAANEAKEHRDEHDAEDKPEGDLEKKRIDNLLAAVDAANREIGGLEYWSDRKHVLKTADSDAEAMQTVATIFDAPGPKPDKDDNPVDHIKGISSNAEVDADPTHKLVHKAYKQQQEEQQSEQPGEKGKGKAKEDRNDGTSSPPRLKQDQVLIPDD